MYSNKNLNLDPECEIQGAENKKGDDYVRPQKVVHIVNHPEKSFHINYILSGRVMPRMDIAFTRTLARLEMRVRRYLRTASFSSLRIGVSW